MKKALFVILAAALAGCCNVNICSEGDLDMIEVDTSSWRLFGVFPIISGDPKYPNRGVSVWFCDSMLLDVNMMMLDNALRANGYTGFKTITTHKTKENLLFLFSRHKLHTSAELTR